jgi:hypothetical protein
MVVLRGGPSVAGVVVGKEPSVEEPVLDLVVGLYLQHPKL